MTDAPFIIFGLPRSRTAWLSRFLSYGDWRCGHEELRHMRTLEDVRAWFTQPHTGTVETAGAPWWRLLPRYAPDARIAVVRRPVAGVVESLMRVEGVTFDRPSLERAMWRLDRKLDQLTARLPNVLTVAFEELENEDACAWLFDHCLGLPHDHDHWSALASVNVQVDFLSLARYAQAYAGALTRLAAAAKQQSLAGMAVRRPVSFEGVSFQSESFDVWKRDGQHLFEEHCVTVGEAPDQWKRKNIPLMRRLYDLGCMQIMTARCNGKMFGYLMTVIAPSLTREGMLTGSNTTFYASPQFPGLGLKLQRAALQALKERGVKEALFEAGKRGDGERLATMYRRLGAADAGQVFRLQLEDA